MESNRCTYAVKLRKVSFNRNWMFTGYWGNGVRRKGAVREGIPRKGRGWSGSEVSGTPEEGSCRWQRSGIQSALSRESDSGLAEGAAQKQTLGNRGDVAVSPKDFGVSVYKMVVRNKTASGRAGPLLRKFIFPKVTEGSYSLNTVFLNYYRKKI